MKKLLMLTAACLISISGFAATREDEIRDNDSQEDLTKLAESIREKVRAEKQAEGSAAVQTGEVKKVAKKKTNPRRTVHFDWASMDLVVCILQSKSSRFVCNGVLRYPPVSFRSAPGVRLSDSQVVIMACEALRMNGVLFTEDGDKVHIGRGVPTTSTPMWATSAQLKEEFVRAFKSTNENVPVDASWNFQSASVSDVVGFLADAMKMALIFCPGLPQERISCACDGMTAYDAASKLYDELIAKKVALFEFEAGIWKAAPKKDAYETFSCEGKTYVRIIAGAEKYAGDIVIPSSIGGSPVVSIGSGAFEDCSSLTSVRIPSGVTNIAHAAFHGCKKLKSVAIPDGVTSIGMYAFKGCSGLTSVTIPSSVTNIGCGAFEYCAGLRSVTMLSGGISIEGGAFGGCKNLVDVDIKGSDAKVATSAFSGDTPVGAKMPDLSKPIGPFHVVVGKEIVDGKCPQRATERKEKNLGERLTARPLPNSHRASDLVLSTNDLIRCDDKRFVTVAVPVDNVCAAEMTNVVGTLLGTNGSVRVLKNINALLVTDEAKNVRCACEVVRISDNSAKKFVERSWRLNYAKAEDAKRILDRFAAGFKPATFRQIPPCIDLPATCLSFAETDEVARGILSVMAEGEENWLTVRMVGLTNLSTTEQWRLVDNWIKAIDIPSRDEDVVEQKFVLKHQDPGRVASAINALLGEGVAVVATSETNAVIAQVRKDSRRLVEDIVDLVDLRLYDWDVTLDVRRVSGVKTLQEARRKASEKDVDTVCRVTSSVMNGRTGVLTGRLDKDNPDTEFKMAVEPRWAGDKDLALKWDVCGSEREGKDFQMSGAMVLCLDQAKVIGGMMRVESRGFFGLGASEEIDTAYLLEITVSEKSRAY